MLLEFNGDMSLSITGAIEGFSGKKCNRFHSPLLVYTQCLRPIVRHYAILYDFQRLSNLLKKKLSVRATWPLFINKRLTITKGHMALTETFFQQFQERIHYKRA